MQGLWWLRVVANVGRFAAIDANILAPYPFRRPCNKVLDAVSSFVLTCMSHTHIVTANVASIDDQYLFRACVDNKAEDTSHTDMPEVELHFAFLQDMIQATRTMYMYIYQYINVSIYSYAFTHSHCTTPESLLVCIVNDALDVLNAFMQEYIAPAYSLPLALSRRLLSLCLSIGQALPAVFLCISHVYIEQTNVVFHSLICILLV